MKNIPPTHWLDATLCATRQTEVDMVDETVRINSCFGYLQYLEKGKLSHEVKIYDQVWKNAGMRFVVLTDLSFGTKRKAFITCRIPAISK